MRECCGWRLHRGPMAHLPDDQLVCLNTQPLWKYTAMPAPKDARDAQRAGQSVLCFVSRFGSHFGVTYDINARRSLPSLNFINNGITPFTIMVLRHPTYHLQYSEPLSAQNNYELLSLKSVLYHRFAPQKVQCFSVRSVGGISFTFPYPSRQIIAAFLKRCLRFAIFLRDVTR